MSRVFIALAAWEPDLRLFDRQVASLSAQSFEDWTGVIVDDGSSGAARNAMAERLAREPRLSLVTLQGRVGFYRNFERALALAPPDCDYVALCDQDDRWAPAKLERQVAALDASPSAELCYTDLRLADAAGTVVASSFWHARPHGRRFREILYNNVVTGATALVRRRLLDAALPFPEDPGGAFHDHWLALCAMASSGLAYLDEPLVDYTQHAGNVLGAQSLEHTGRGALVRLLGDGLKGERDGGLRGGLDELAAHAARVETRLQSFAEALRVRHGRLPPEMEAALRPFLRDSRLGRSLDLAVPTFLGTLVAGEETNLEPLKISVGLAWAAIRWKS
jgi:hypothetical protein